MIRINLLSDREAIRKETSRQQISIYFLMIILLMVVLATVQYRQIDKKKNLEVKIQQVNEAVEALKLKVGEVEKYKKDKKDLEEKLSIIDKLQTGKMLVAQLLDHIELTIPEKIWIEKLTFKGSTFSMEGYAIDDETIAKFMKDLERSQSFSNVELGMTEHKDVEGLGIRHFSLVTSFVAPPDPSIKSDKKKITSPKG